MKKINVLIVLTVLLFSIACTKQSEVSESKFQTYNGQYYSIDYPLSWVIKTQGNVIGFLSPSEGKGDFMENVNVILSQDTKNTAVDSAIESTIASAQKSFDEFNVVSKEKETISGLYTIKLVATASKQGQTLKFNQWVGKKDNLFFVITYTGFPGGYESHLADAEKMIASFKMK
jgi:hypothetical protein